MGKLAPLTTIYCGFIEKHHSFARIESFLPSLKAQYVVFAWRLELDVGAE